MELPENRRQAILEAIYAGAPRKVEAIKLVREATGCGLKDAKDFVEKFSAELYAKEPEKFAKPPTVSMEFKGGCSVATAVILLVLVGIALGMLLLLRKSP
jgi:hypothetical protein